MRFIERRFCHSRAILQLSERLSLRVWLRVRVCRSTRSLAVFRQHVQLYFLQIFSQPDRMHFEFYFSLISGFRVRWNELRVSF